MRLARVLVAGLLLVSLGVVGVHGAGPVPPLGPFLDPWNGVWAAAASAKLPSRVRARILGLSAPVRVLYDSRAVPHLFAQSELDAYRALGYVVARDRLFQLEVQTRATAGTLTELVGPAALASDRLQRGLGLAASAEREWAGLDSTSPSARAARAFAEGVSAWIAALRRRDWPLEYHLLGARPMPWKPQYSLYLMKRMGYTLAFNQLERGRQAVARLVGEHAADALFPIHSPIQQPIQPGPGPYPRFDFARLPPPAGEPRLTEREPVDRGQRPAVPGRAPLAPDQAVSGWASSFGPAESDGERLGSNNWAVAPRRSASGHALLAGDPHLDLTLPSIWYEVHLVAARDLDGRPGAGGGPALDVYGVTIPGFPAVVIGFNRDVAWSFTNTENDVLDLYAETLDDPRRPTRYWLDGAWRPVGRRIERFIGRRGELLAVDTVYATHRGPLIRDAEQPVSLRWLVLEAGAGDALLQAQRAHTAEQWLGAMESFRTPAQNGLVADRWGTISIRSTGAFPIRPGDGRGDRIRDGSTSRSDWEGFWPLARYPQATDPEQGYLFSANQEPKDPRVDPGYLRSHWPAPWRAMRIARLLAADTAVTVDAMRRYQTDPGSERAEAFVPVLLELGRRALGRRGSESADLARALALLAQWDRRYTKDDQRAILFELAMEELADRLWDELELPGRPGAPRVATPGEAVLLEALHDTGSVWWDDRRTRDRREQASEIVAQSLEAALRRAIERYGDPDRPGAWRWDRIHRINVYHLLRIPSFSALQLPVDGGPSTISPSSGGGTHGASWRMVVELGPEVRGWGIYPGGQSGNPASPRYLDRLDRWLAGELDPLSFPRTAEELERQGALARWTIEPMAARP